MLFKNICIVVSSARGTELLPVAEVILLCIYVCVYLTNKKSVSAFLFHDPHNTIYTFRRHGDRFPMSFFLIFVYLF